VPIFVERSWSTIREQKELNLPDQREMVANYRCNEIKDESYRLVEEKITDLTRISAEKEVPGYKDKCQEVTSLALNHFSKQSRQYDREVSGKIQLELTEHIMSQLFFSFDAQMKVLKHRVLESFKTEIKKLEARELDEVANSIAKILEALKEAKIGSYKRHSDELLFDGSGWEKHVILHVTEIKETIVDLANNCRDRLLSKLT